MPKNIKGGNKAKKGKNSQPTMVAKEIVYPDKSGYQIYAIMEQYLGHTSIMLIHASVHQFCLLFYQNMNQKQK